MVPSCFSSLTLPIGRNIFKAGTCGSAWEIISQDHFSKRYSTVREPSGEASGPNSSVDPKEIHAFKGQSAKWWNMSGEMQLLHNMNKLRVPFVRDGLINMAIVADEHRDTDKPLKGLKLLDVGCGGGFLAEPLARLGAKVTGIDATPELINIAKDHMEDDGSLSDNLKYIHTTIEEFTPKNKESFDAVVTSEVIEHITEKQNFLKNCVECLKPGAPIFITTINQTMLARVLVIFVGENVLGLVPKGTHEYDKFISPHKLQRMLEECDCTTKRTHGMTVNPITHQWCWIPYNEVSYALHAVKN